MVISEIPLNELKAGLSQLERSVRAELTEFLRKSLHDDEPIQPDPPWEAELDRRVAEMRSGNATALSAREVIAQLREKYS